MAGQGLSRSTDLIHYRLMRKNLQAPAYQTALFVYGIAPCVLRECIVRYQGRTGLTSRMDQDSSAGHPSIRSFRSTSRIRANDGTAALLALQR